MGYRSDVTAAFYVTVTYKDPSPIQKEKAESTFKFWWAANFADCPEEMRDSFKPFPEGSSVGYIFVAEDVKWYDSFPDVQWFNAFVGKFMKDLCNNDELDGNSGLDRYFAYESIRSGEDINDVEQDICGGDAYCLLSLERSIQVSFPQSEESRKKSVANLAAKPADLGCYVINEGQTDHSSLCPEQQANQEREV